MAVQLNLSNEEFQPEKQRLPDNTLSFVPKTGTTNFDMQQMFEIAIPRTNHIIRLNKGYFQIELHLRMTKSAAATVADNENTWYVGINSAAAIFDQVQVKNNGRTILSDTYAQIAARLRNMQKSTEFNDSMNSCYINYKDIRKNVGFTYIRSRDIATTGSDVTFRMRVPVGDIFDCFSTCDNFSTTQLIDDIVLSLQLSDPKQYLTLVEVNADFSVKRVEKFTGSEQEIVAAKDVCLL